MTLIINNMAEFIDNYDPYETDRKKIYANCHVDTKYEPSYYEPRERERRSYKQRTYKKQRAITCANCGKLFHSGEHERRYCSNECKVDAMNRRRREKYKASKASKRKRGANG